MTQPPNYEVNWLTLRPRLARFLPPGQFDRLRALPAELEQVEPEHQAVIASALRAAANLSSKAQVCC